MTYEDPVKVLNSTVYLYREKPEWISAIEIKQRKPVSFRPLYPFGSSGQCGIFAIHYTDGIDDGKLHPEYELTMTRNESIKMLYLCWCDANNIKANTVHEGYFSSKKFTEYWHSIGYTNFNYAIYPLRQE
jgi:hypothetical protein